MAIPTVIAANQTGGAIPLSRLGLTVPAAGTLNLSLYAYIDEMLQDESLYNAIAAGNILLNYGNGNLTQGDSLKFFNFVTQEARIPVRAMSTVNVASLSGVGGTMDTSVTLVADDRVLLTGQTTASENGIWVVKAGAWVRPEDFDTDQSAASAIVAIQEGSVHAGEVWTCTSITGSDVIDTSNLAFAQLAGGGGGGTLQDAYDAGNSIVTAGGVDIVFQLTNGDFTVDDGSVLFGGGTALTAFNVDTGLMSLDSTDTTNLSMTANDAGAKTLTIAATNAGAGTGNLDVNVDDAITIDSSAGGISLDGVTASNFTVTGAGQDLTLSSVGGSVVIDGSEAAADAVRINASGAAGGIDMDAGTAGVTIDSTGAISLDGVGASNFSTTSGNLALSTATTGSVLVDGVDGVEVNSSAGALNFGNDADDGAINIGTGTTTGRVITIGNNTGTTGVAIETGSGNLLVDAPNTRLTGNLVVDGTTTTVHSEIVNISDNFLYLNADYTTAVAMAGGIVVNSLPTATSDTVAVGGFTAAVPATSNATVATTGAATFSAGDFIQVSGAANQTNDGIYEVLSHAANVLTIKGIGLTAGTYEFTQNDFATDATAQGTITKINLGVTQVDTTGTLQYGYGPDSATLVFEDVIVTSTLTLQGAYDGGNTIATAGGNSVVISGSESLQVTATGGINLDTVFDADVTVFDVLMTGNNGFSIDGTASSNVTATNTVASTNVTMALEATNTGAVAGDATVQINATSTNGVGVIDLNADDTVAIDVLSGGAINIGTTAVAQTTTIGNNTGATGVVVNSGTEMVVVDGVTYYGKNAGAPTPTGAGFADGDKYFDTNLDMEMRYDATRAKWLSVEAMFIQFGRNGNTAAGQYYRGIDGRVMSATDGYYMPHNGTVVGLGYTRTDSDAATFDVVEGGVSRATVASAAVSGGDNTLNGNFTAGGILAVQNTAASNPTSDVMAWVKVKWRT